MTSELKVVVSQENQIPDLQSKDETEFCDSAVLTMCRYYGVDKLNFEQMLREGYTDLNFGRGPLGFHDKKTGKYIVSFAAFTNRESGLIETFEIRKVCDAFGSFSEGLSRNKYSPDKYQKTVDKFKLILTTEDLSGFVQRYNWPQ